jgi:hypothetical protein
MGGSDIKGRGMMLGLFISAIDLKSKGRDEHSRQIALFQINKQLNTVRDYGVKGHLLP